MRGIMAGRWRVVKTKSQEERKGKRPRTACESPDEMEAEGRRSVGGVGRAGDFERFGESATHWT
jgi:hypothetical protein